MRSAGFFWEFQADGICKVEQWSVWNSCNFTSSLTPSYWINSGCQSCQLEPATPKQLSSQSATQQLRFKPHTSALPTGTFRSLGFNFEQNSVGQHSSPGGCSGYFSKPETESPHLIQILVGLTLWGVWRYKLGFRGSWGSSFFPGAMALRFHTWAGCRARHMVGEAK